MDPVDVLRALMEVASDARLEVRVVRPGREGDAAPAGSAVCRVRGAVWVVLAAGDPVEEQVDILRRALVTHAADYVSSHYLPPAVRAQLDAVSSES